jgi:glycosyltransferase involved in cell wall biosynthesis
MKKLIYILNQYSNKEGSHFYHILHLLEEMARNGIDIKLIIEKATDIPNFNIPNIEVIAQKKTGIQRPIELFSILKKLNTKGYKKTFIRISQNGALPAIVVSKIYGGETYYWHSGTTHKTQESDIPSFSQYLKSVLPFNLVKKYINYFVTGPETMLDYYHEYVGVKKEKLVCLYNDIDISRFKKIGNDKEKTLKNELEIYHSKKIILFVHRLSPVRKSLFYMPYILKDILLNREDYICYVIGGGNEQYELKELIKKDGLEDKVFVMGEKPNSEIQKYYQVSDIFINPTYTEGFPRVLIEAMASGLPVVTTNAGGTADIVGKIQSEFMVDIEDREGFAIKLKELIKDEEIQQRLSNENIIQVKKFSTENVAQMYIREIFKND